MFCTQKNNEEFGGSNKFQVHIILCKQREVYGHDPIEIHAIAFFPVVEQNHFNFLSIN